MPKLTKKLIENAEIREKSYFIFDNLISGFAVRISPNGKKYYYYQYLKNKQIKRVSLGLHGIITTELAREQAIDKLSYVKSGGDPQKEITDKKQAPTIKDIAGRFLEEYVCLHCKPNTKQNYERYMQKNIIPVIGNVKISEISQSDVINLHHSLRASPVAANRCISFFSIFCNVMERWGIRKISSNPCKHLKKFRETQKTRCLSEDEVMRLAKVLEEFKLYPEENISAVYCIQLLLLTGCRLSEIRTLKWEYIDYEKKLLRLPDSKTGAKTVYAGETVMNLLDEIKNNPSRPEDNEFVIWGKKPGSCLNNIYRSWKRMCKEAELKKVRIHDLRHSFASFFANDGTSLHMIAKLLGHSQTKTTERYSHIVTDSLLKTSEKITGKLGAILNVSEKPKSPDKIKQKENFITVKGTNTQAPVYLSCKQAAEYLQVKISLLEFWRWKKRGPRFAKVGSRVRYKLADLEGFIKHEESESV